jgi:hypothetical protein
MLNREKEKDNQLTLAYILKSLGYIVKTIEEDGLGVVITVNPRGDNTEHPRMIN